MAEALRAYGFKEVNFADALKNCCAEAFGFPRELFFDNARKELPLDDYGYQDETPRSILQHVGTELFRSRWPSIWINTWSRVAMQHPRIVVSDMRFPNEFDAVKALGGYTIRVTRPGYGAPDTHASESHYKDFPVDVDLMNEGPISVLQLNALFKVAERFNLGDAAVYDKS